MTRIRTAPFALALVLATASAADAQARRAAPDSGTRTAARTESSSASDPSSSARTETRSVEGPDSRSIDVERRVEMRSTAYCLRGTTRTGVRVRDGIAAGDPSVLPLGSVVRVSHPDGRLIGVFVIMDTGGAVRGNKIDLWFSDCGEAEDWGTRTVITEVLDIGRA